MATPFFRAAAFCFGLIVAAAPFADAQVLLREDFDGTGIVDPTVWRLPFGSEGTFVGRTQFRGNAATDFPLQGVAEPLADDDKVAELHLDTYSVIDPGNQFLGTDLLTKRNFARGGGLSYSARMRLKPTTVGGLVAGAFLFDVTRDSPPGANNLVRDEIDWELISNQAVGSASNDPFSNVWNDGPFSDGGAGAFHNVAGVDLTQFNDYRVDWTPQAIRWYVNNTLVRLQNTNVPDDPMKLHFNLWAPSSTFSEAFNAALQPTNQLAQNQRFTVQIDTVEVNRFDTAVSNNLLTDGSFETTIPSPIQNFPPTTINRWLRFGNVSIEGDDPTGANPNVPDQAPDGIFLAKMFGPFNGRSDASGLLQNVLASEGQEFEASIKALTPNGDSIQGNQNFNTIALSFLNASGAVIQEAFASPTNLVDRNGRDFPLLDGRDANLVEDQFVEGVVSAIAPPGTAFARVSLLFVQIANQGGSTWFDDARLVRLSQSIVPTIPGDFNRDGVVNAGDYTVWRNNVGGDPASLGNNGNGDGVVNSLDYDLWSLNYGRTAPSSAIATPEPGAAVLVLLGVATTLLASRRG